MLFALVLLPFIAATPVPLCEDNFGFASYYASNMVLQRGNSSAVVWGYSTEDGDEVTVTIGDEEYTTIAQTGPTGRPEWSVKLAPRGAGNDAVSISASSVACPEAVTLDNVLFGDVYICSGQSNMAHTMNNIDDPDDDINDAVNYPNVRTFFAGREVSDEPQYDLLGIVRNWEEPTADNIRPFSAICWLFGRDLNIKYDIPIGLIHSSWGGTRIQAWSSTDVNDDTACYPNGPGDGGNPQNEREALWNSMIYPFLRMPIFGALWYQGEANQGQPDSYVCAMSRMVIDWRAKWSEATDGETDPDFSFGQVQLAPNGNDSNPNSGFPKLRWAQAGQIGYIPHGTDEGQYDYTNIYMAVAADQPDYESPTGSIHPRYKRPLAYRLFLAALQVAYEDDSEGRFQGPFPTEFNVEDDSLTITYDNGNVALESREPEGNGEPTVPAAFEICCVDDDENKDCQDGSANWQEAPISNVDGATVTLTVGCEEINGLRYIWRVTPCERDRCPLYSVENELPAPPYRLDRTIAGNMKL